MMSIAGFCLIVIDGLGYVFTWELKSLTLLIFGLAFVVIGL